MTDYDVTKQCGQMWDKAATKQIEKKNICIDPDTGGPSDIKNVCDIIKQILSGLVETEKMSQGIADIIYQLCPDVLQTCCGDINKLNCDTISRTFNSLVTNETLLDMIQKKVDEMLGFEKDVDIRNYQVCDIVQIISSMGIDIVGIFMDKLGSKLADMNINLTKDDYEGIIRCICPQYTDKKINCDKVVLLVQHIISEPAFQKLVKAPMVINSPQDICNSLQKMVDDGNDPVEMIYNYLLNKPDPTPPPIPPVNQCDSTNCPPPDSCNNNECIKFMPPIDPCEICKNAAPCFTPEGCDNRYKNNGKWSGDYINCEEKGAGACAPSCYPACIDPIPPDTFNTCNTATKRSKCDEKPNFKIICMANCGSKGRDVDGKWQWSDFYEAKCNPGAACEACYPPGCGAVNSKMRMRGLKSVNYIPTKEKIFEAIKCICPNYTGPKPKPKPKSVINKLNVGLLTVGGSVLTIILYLILFFFVFRLLSVGLKILIFVGLMIVTILIVGMIINKNPSCLFKTCSGDDWKAITGTFKGEKTLGNITVNAQLKIDGKIITLELLNCDGDSCPFKTLPEACKSAPVIKLGDKTDNGYNISGACIDEIKKGTVQNLWLVQTGSNISIKIMIKGFIVNIPLTKIEPYAHCYNGKMISNSRMNSLSPISAGVF